MLSCQWFATVDDTDNLQPLKQTHGFSLWSSAYRWGPRRRCFCNSLSAAPSRAPLVRCRWFRPLYLTREAPRLCHVKKRFSRLQKIFYFCDNFSLLDLAPIDDVPASSPMQRLSAFYATMRTNKSNNYQSTNMLKSKFNTKLPQLRYVEKDIWRPRPVRTSPAHDARLRTHQSGACSCFCTNHFFQDDSHQHDARPPHARYGDRRDARTAYYLCTVFHYSHFLQQN